MGDNWDIRHYMHNLMPHTRFYIGYILDYLDIFLLDKFTFTRNFTYQYFVSYLYIFIHFMDIPINFKVFSDTGYYEDFKFIRSS